MTGGPPPRCPARKWWRSLHWTRRATGFAGRSRLARRAALRRTRLGILARSPSLE